MTELFNQANQINNYFFDERYYELDGVYLPSVTYLLSNAYPPGYGLSRWRGDVGNERADQIMNQAGDDGSFVHDALDRMVKGETIPGSEVEAFPPKRALKIHRSLTAFLDWYTNTNPVIQKTEFKIFNKEDGYAGTVDLLCEIDGEQWIVDYKTSKTIQDKHKVQLAAYGKAVGVKNIAILHLGNTTKKHWSFLKVDYDRYWEQFEVTLKMFKILNPNAKPSLETVPEEYKLIG